MYKYVNNLINELYTINSDVHNYTNRQKQLLHVINVILIYTQRVLATQVLP